MAVPTEAGAGPLVHLLDGTWELFRAYFAAPGATAPDGREVGAARGLLRSLAALLRDEAVTHVGIAFDTVVESFRNAMFDGYKTGEGIEPALLQQFPLAEEVAAALGLVVWPMKEFEADDALATAAARLSGDPAVGQVRLCSPDKDLAQCVSGDRVVQMDRKSGALHGQDAVRERYGIEPVSIPDWLGLVGDAADGIPGIPRWGAKSASAVLAVYHHVEAIPDAADDWSVKVRGAAALASNLAERRSDAVLYRDLAVLRTDVPLGADLESLRWRGPDESALASVCRELGVAPPRFDRPDGPW